MTRKQRFDFMIEPGQLDALRLIEKRTGAPVSVQIRRAIEAYLRSQTVLSRSELRKLLRVE